MYKCVICNKAIVGRFVRDKWGNRAHASHQPVACFSCGRIVSEKTSKGGVHHPDGRVVCNYCYADCIKRDPQVNKAFTEVKQELNSVGFRGMPQTIPINLIDATQIKEMGGSDRTEGLTHLSKKVSGVRVVDVQQTIYILNYLNQLHFKAVLAHELLHVWSAHHRLKLGNYEEALCNIGATLIYNLHKPSKLAEVLNDRMKMSRDPDYGIRFMELKMRLKEMGWERFIEFIKSNR